MIHKLTQQDIANHFNISRTTVARALYGNGYVNNQLKTTIRQFAEKEGYSANGAAIALRKSKPITIFCFLLSYEDEYGKQLEKGIQLALKELGSYGITVEIFHHTSSNYTQQEIDFGKSLQRKKPDAVIISAANPVAIQNHLAAKRLGNIPLAALSAPFSRQENVFFVGADEFASGAVCAELMAKFMGFDGTVLYAGNADNIFSNNNRFNGFLHTMQNYPHIHTIIENDWLHFDYYKEKTDKALAKYPQMKGIYSNTTIVGIDTALQNAGRQDIILIGNDWSERCFGYFKDNTIDCVLYHRPILQGYLALKRLAKHILFHETLEKEITVGFDIITSTNTNPERYFELLV